MNELAEKIYNIMSKNASLIAKPILENNCTRIGKSLDTITLEDMDPLFPRLRRGMAFFFDEKVADKTIKEIKVALSL
jgi:hypothetical protein